MKLNYWTYPCVAWTSILLGCAAEVDPEEAMKVLVDESCACFESAKNEDDLGVCNALIETEDKQPVQQFTEYLDSKGITKETLFESEDPLLGNLFGCVAEATFRVKSQ